MDQKTLIDLFERKDKKRRRQLFELYFDLITSTLSASYIAEMICKDIGQADMVSGADIKFCRFHFKNKVVHPAIRPVSKPKPVSGLDAEPRPDSQSSSFSACWSDPDTMSTQENMIVQSKFSKK